MVHHYMTPTGVFFVLALALAIDALRVGPNAFSDRVAWFLAVPGIYEGFHGSPPAEWTIGQVASFIDWAKEQGQGVYLAGASTQGVIGILLLVVVILTIGVLLPLKATKRFGRLATLTFSVKDHHRLNWKMWASAAIIAIFCDVPLGNFGGAIRGTIGFMAATVSWLPTHLMGLM